MNRENVTKALELYSEFIKAISTEQFGAKFIDFASEIKPIVSLEIRAISSAGIVYVASVTKNQEICKEFLEHYKEIEHDNGDMTEIGYMAQQNVAVLHD